MRFVLPWLPIGFAINVAVAWGLAAWQPYARWKTVSYFDRTQSGTLSLLVEGHRNIGTSRRGCEYAYHDEWQYPHYPPFIFATESDDSKWAFNTDGPLKGQRWGRVEAVFADPRAFLHLGVEHATGWPLLTAWCEWTRKPMRSSIDPFKVHGGISTTKDSMNAWVSSAPDIRALPNRPIWLG